jgi:hypothetical protein
MCLDESVGPPGWMTLTLFTTDHIPSKINVFNGHAVRTLYGERKIAVLLVAV